MNERSTIWAAVAGIGLVTVCCGGPVLIGALSILSASVLLGWATHIFFPTAILLAVVVGVVGYARFRRTRAAIESCSNRSDKPARTLR